MATHKVATPVPGYAGVVGSVHFANGVAEVDEATHAAELAYFRAQGYAVEDLAAESQPAADEAEAMPKKSASTEAWRAWAVERGGMDPADADALGRDELVEHFTKETPS